ncbi:type II toxin-antitoxin system RelE/ParE family toxin [Notoacmeibacter ruber]|uniref:type II toxin-antitoxin system RelE/ParE family toxin n=1 Tax=Notoacmeibacter ruber TaxID=2670375 RepID=UPI003CCA73EF
MPDPVSDKLDAMILLVERFGPNLGRPGVDRLNASAHANMKELRFKLDGVWRFAFAFDPERNAIVLVGGNKEGRNQRRFYKQLIATADQRFDDWLMADND